MADVVSRLINAVKTSSINEGDLAKELGIHRTTLSRYLNGHLEMPASVMVGLMNSLGLRLSDLQEDSEREMRVLLRADHPEVVKQPFFNRTLDRLRFYTRAIEELELTYPEVGLPERHNIDDKNHEEIEDSALETRRVLHLPERGPVTGLFSSLSRAIKLVGFQLDSDLNCDGFTVSSVDFGTGIAVNIGPKINFERRLATVAHELGHAVLHPNDFAPIDNIPKSVRSKDGREKAAWVFAGKFLVPSADLRNLFYAIVGPKGSYVPPGFILQVKHLYGVSASLLLTRLLSEKLVTGEMYGSLKKRFYPNGSKEELHPLSEVDCKPFGSPEHMFENLVARMFFSEKVSESRVLELLELQSANAESWFSKQYDMFGERIELAT